MELWGTSLQLYRCMRRWLLSWSCFRNQLHEWNKLVGAYTIVLKNNIKCVHWSTGNIASVETLYPLTMFYPCVIYHYHDRKIAFRLKAFDARGCYGCPGCYPGLRQSCLRQNVISTNFLGKCWDYFYTLGHGRSLSILSCHLFLHSTPSLTPTWPTPPTTPSGRGWRPRDVRLYTNSQG